jgi:hypothetical protein
MKGMKDMKFPGRKTPNGGSGVWFFHLPAPYLEIW